MIAARISNIRKILRGPMVVFFTSYEFLHKVQNALLETTLTHYLIEEKSMSIAEQDAIIDSLISHKDGVLLAVAGGKFSEGEDYRAGNLRCAVVVGLPLPPPSLELSERLKYASIIRSKRYAYESLILIPAMNRVVQSAGRVVRNQRKKGVVILMDKRFLQRRIKELMPFWLKRYLFHLDCSDFTRLQNLIGDTE
jgi:DNA excision repair protein ERCC-2